jgi:hypothetical protein
LKRRIAEKHKLPPYQQNLMCEDHVLGKFAFLLFLAYFRP